MSVASGFEEMRASLAPTASLLHELADFAMALDHRHAHVPVVESRAMEELAREATDFSSKSIWTGPVTDTHALAGILLLASGDFARSYATLLVAERTPVYGHLSVVRSALEAGVVGEWLNDPSIGVVERIRRGLAERYYSAREQMRFPATREHGREQVVHIKSVATAYGWTASGAKQRDATINGSGRPSVPDSFSRLLVGDTEKEIGKALWSYLSGVSHSVWWALRQSITQPPSYPEGSQAPRPAGFGTDGLQVGAQTICLSRILRSAVSARMKLMGWPRDEWVDIEGRLQKMEGSVIQAVVALQHSGD
ncbi:MAG: hypothetical protein M0010_22290 [Actinomycetota bacterium]|jgi:hypothetical protein|nr:hypothetical protein [Actinomycetota bacterium]